MSTVSTSFQQLLRSARAGDEAARGRLLERFRGYLRVLALRQMDVRVQRRVDASDLVQQTFLSAHRNFAQFSGSTENSLVAWLRKIHARNVQDLVREHVGAEKRSVKREEYEGEIPHEAVLQQTSTLRPSQRVLLNEDAARLADLLEQLPEAQREVIRLRYLEGLALKEIGEHMQRSREAVAGLLKRGMRRLRELFDQPLSE